MLPPLMAGIIGGMGFGDADARHSYRTSEAGAPRGVRSGLAGGDRRRFSGALTLGGLVVEVRRGQAAGQLDLAEDDLFIHDEVIRVLAGR